MQRAVLHRACYQHFATRPACHFIKTICIKTRCHQYRSHFHNSRYLNSSRQDRTISTQSEICNATTFQHGISESEALLAILQKAPHGINSLERLAFEADVGHRNDLGLKLIDLPVNRQDLDLWLVLFDYRVLQHGQQGVSDILYAMSFRGPAVKLIEQDDVSEQIWKMSLSAASDDDEILYMLSNPLKSIARDRNTLFLDLMKVIAHTNKLEQAGIVTSSLGDSHFHGHEDLISLSDLVLAGEMSISMFCVIYQHLPFVGIYSYLISRMWEADRHADASHLHDFLLNHEDFPREFEDIEPLIRHLAESDQSLGPLLRNLEGLGIFYSAQARRYFDRTQALRRGTPIEALQYMNADHPTIPRRRLKDQFVARVFATSAFSFELSVKSLKFLGLVEVGPLAVREMANSSANLQELKRRFQLLAELDIDTGSSNFVIVTKALCESNSSILLQAVLTSDQHHDVFEDRTTQKRLLSEYYSKRDWLQINRTLAILNRGKFDMIAQQRAQHLLLHSAITIHDWRGTLQCLSRLLRYRRQHLSEAPDASADNALLSIISTIISKGLLNKFFNSDYLDRVRYLIGILQDMQISGLQVKPDHWQAVIFRLGRLGWFDELQRLVLWIASYHKKSQKLVFEANKTAVERGPSPDLLKIFDTRFQAALMRWSINSADRSGRNGSKLLQTTKRFVQLLQILEREFGLPLDVNVMRDVHNEASDTILSATEDGEDDDVMVDSSRRDTATVRHSYPIRSALWDMSVSDEDEKPLRKAMAGSF